MKKVSFVILLFLVFCLKVDASNFVTYTTYVSKCSNVFGNSVVIPVRVVSVDSGVLSSSMTNYKLGEIDVLNAQVSVENIEGNSILNIGVKDAVQGVSEIYFSLSDDLELKNVDDIMSFNLVYTFKGDVPKTIRVLDNNIVLLNDFKVCEALNSFDLNVLESQALVSEKNVNNKTYYVVVIVIFIIVAFVGLGVFLLFLVKKK